MMKYLKNLLLFATVFIFANQGFSQLAPVKKFDVSILKDKTLYIPDLETRERYVKRMSKKGKFDKISEAEAFVAAHNKAWREAMAESSYDATDYEIRGIDYKALYKSKDPKAVLLQYYEDKYGNEQAMLVVTGPKKKVIARTIVTGLNLSEKNDIRLMMNMLNESLTTAGEIQEEGNKANIKNITAKYKTALVDWAEDLENKTFLVPKSEHKNEKKATSRNADLEEALKNWTLSKYEFTTEDEVNAKRINGDENSYYWKTFRIFTQSALLTFNYNLIISTDGDNIVAGFMGKKRLKPSTLTMIQNKITAKVDRYKKQLAR